MATLTMETIAIALWRSSARAFEYSEKQQVVDDVVGVRARVSPASSPSAGGPCPTVNLNHREPRVNQILPIERDP